MKAKSSLVGLLLLSTWLALGAAPAQAKVDTWYPFIGRIPEAVISECRDYTYGLDYADEYAWVEMDSSPQISAPTDVITIKIYFSQDCPGGKEFYTRNLSLIRPDGTLMPLVKHPTLSYSGERRYSASCYSLVTSCWGHSDVYLLRHSSAAMVGDYGLRFTTNYTGSVCSTTSGASVCERNVPFEKSFDLPRFFSLTQTGIPAPWELPEATVVPPASNSDLKLLDKANLTRFAGRSTSLSSAHKRAIDSLLLENPETQKVVCTSLNSKSSTLTQKVMSKKRALAACNYALSSNQNLQISTTSKEVSNRSLFGGVLISAEG